MSLYETQSRVRRKQKKEHEWDSLQGVWEQRLNGSLMDIADPEEFSSATTTKSGDKKFFLCDSSKIPVDTIKEEKFTLRRKKAPPTTLSSGSTTSLSKSLGASTKLPKLSILKSLPSSELLKLSFVRPTLTGASIGPGDAHKRSLANYYHVSDHLAPDPLDEGEVPGSIILHYENSAPPMRPVPHPSKPDAGLLCGATGKEIPFPHVSDYRDEQEKLRFASSPVKALNKNTSQTGQRSKRVLQYGNRKPTTSTVLLDYIDEVTAAGSSAGGSLSVDGQSVGGNSVASSATGRTNATNRSNGKGGKKEKAMTREQVDKGLEEMKSLMEEMSTGSDGGSKKWASAGLAIQKHFNMIRKNNPDAPTDLYKDVPVTRFFKRFVEEGPRRGDGCFEINPAAVGAQQIEGLLHSTKEYASVKRVNAKPGSVENMKQTLTQARILKDLKAELAKAQRRLESSKIWQDQHGARGDRVKDKRDWGGLFDSSSEEEEEEVVVEERPKTREELWTTSDVDLFAKEEVKKEVKKKEEYSDREVFGAGMELLEDVLQEYVCDYIMVELELLEDIGMLACVVEVQARFRGWRWRNSNYKVVNRLAMRAKNEHGNWYYLNTITNESQWASEGA
ncbi:hypothetical protein TeGR_g2291 [Tetraparma gracilis]|uniref:WW domain-containing protein n=1 Tax=Tetraparma gracilis TaxID=2962635 RepID=A0ABQ6MZV2_9STRA|nr:hypothetical protein TeGR_g2291 [Tetraparma gracilis]